MIRVAGPTRYEIVGTTKWFATRAKAEAWLQRQKPEAFELRAGGAIQHGALRRPFVVVRVAPAQHRAFYVSTGSGGGAALGQWVVFGGVNDSGTWMIKAWNFDTADPHWHIKDVPKYRPVVAWLGRNRAHALALADAGPIFVFGSDKAANAREAKRVNAFIHQFDAFDEMRTFGPHFRKFPGLK